MEAATPTRVLCRSQHPRKKPRQAGRARFCGCRSPTAIPPEVWAQDSVPRLSSGAGAAPVERVTGSARGDSGHQLAAKARNPGFSLPAARPSPRPLGSLAAAGSTQGTPATCTRAAEPRRASLVLGRQPTSKVIGHFKWRAKKTLGPWPPSENSAPVQSTTPPGAPRPFPTPRSPLLRLCPALPLGWAPNRGSSVPRERPTLSSVSATHAPPLRPRPTLPSH